MGQTLPRVELWSEEGSGYFTSWDDSLELVRRTDGSYSLRLRRRGDDTPRLMTLYRSRPFRTPERLLDEIQRRLPEAVGDNLYRPFTVKDTLDILAELIDFDQQLAKAALQIVAIQLEGRRR